MHHRSHDQGSASRGGSVSDGSDYRGVLCIQRGYGGSPASQPPVGRSQTRKSRVHILLECFLVWLNGHLHPGFGRSVRYCSLDMLTPTWPLVTSHLADQCRYCSSDMYTPTSQLERPPPRAIRWEGLGLDDPVCAQAR